MTRVVLVADDEPDIRFMAKLRLQRNGWEVIEAPDGEAAADVVRGRDLDGMVLDHRMPGRTGLEVAQLARSLSYDGPIILFSAYLDPVIESDAVELRIRTLGKADVPLLADTLEALAAGVAPEDTGENAKVDDGDVAR